jgi:eukaryotic-like serine/threonine-protein kinase
VQPLADNDNDALLGTMLGHDYRVIERIGAGGMGVVYVVEHATLKKRFAAKVLSAELTASVEARERFAQEAHAASLLEHENIVIITNHGVTDDDRPYLVMELLKGRTLSERLAEGPLSLEECASVIIPTCQAIEAAHEANVLHRDIKPENIFLTQRSGGRFGIKVLDFGIAKTPGAKTSKLTAMGTVLGSPVYMAPESCRGESIDGRADLYSIAVILFEMLCGQPPFYDENMLKVLQMQVNDPVPSMIELCPDLPSDLENALLRGLEKKRDLRYATVTEFREALERALPLPVVRATTASDNSISRRMPLTAPPTGWNPAVVAKRGLGEADTEATLPVFVAPKAETSVAVQQTVAASSPAVESPKSNRRAVIVVAALSCCALAAAAAWFIQNRSTSPSASTTTSTTNQTTGNPVGQVPMVPAASTADAPKVEIAPIDAPVDAPAISVDAAAVIPTVSSGDKQVPKPVKKYQPPHKIPDIVPPVVVPPATNEPSLNIRMSR